ncbi:hypothetical protein FRX31_025636, partial [Thalictrum thalictroides]
GIKDKSNGFPTQDGDNRDSNEGSSSDGEEEDSDPSTKDSKMSKKPRGLTNPTHVLDNSCKIKIIFNGRGQPVGETSVSFSTELGNFARDMVPLNFDDWRTILMKKIQEIKDSTPPVDSSQTIANDILSKVLGPERNGHVRGAGSGVTPSKLGMVSQNTLIVSQLQERVTTMQEAMDRLTNICESQKDLINTLIAKQQGQSVGAGQFMQLLGAFLPTSTNPSPTAMDASPSSETANPTLSTPTEPANPTISTPSSPVASIPPVS